jgi:hypothetical protein
MCKNTPEPLPILALSVIFDLSPKYHFCHIERAGSAHPTGLTRLKLWAFRTLKNTISNIFSDLFTHSFSLVEPLLALLLDNTLYPNDLLNTNLKPGVRKLPSAMDWAIIDSLLT